MKIWPEWSEAELAAEKWVSFAHIHTHTHTYTHTHTHTHTHTQYSVLSARRKSLVVVREERVKEEVP